ncbi:MAG: N-acetylneuraminate synthase family protein [Chloroflexi bacterium]|nr:N-acetylneuraminate synthase family protein [Chloroflexota bacterium]
MKPEIQIAHRTIGEDHPPFVIPEIGINHEGSFEKAKKMIADAHRAGAECVKFQSHVVEDEMVPEAKKIIPGNATESIYAIMERCSLTEEEERKLKQYAEKMGMIYLCTPFSRAAADRLERLGVVAYKIGSGECNNYPLVEHIASFRKPVILSTGMNDLGSIARSVGILERAGAPYALLHCTSMYPTPYDKVRLGALADLKSRFPEAVLGLSDHSLGNYTCFAAISLGASILEKHFTSSRRWPGPDVPISMTPAELKDLVNGSKAIHQSLGGHKTILSEEKPTIDFAYASVVAIKDIKKGERFTVDNTWVKRPGTGIPAVHLGKILGRRASRNIDSDTLISRQDFAAGKRARGDRW